MTPEDEPSEGNDGPERALDQPGAGQESSPARQRVKKVKRRRASPPEAPSPPERPTEPIVEVREGEAPTAVPPTSGLREVDVELDVIGTSLYRERHIIEEVVEEKVPPRPRAWRRGRGPEGRSARERAELERLQRELEREERRRRSWLRGTLAYKTFYDMVCNRIGVIIAGFGVAMIVFTMLYDWLQGGPLRLGQRHMLALGISLAVWFLGMGLEGLRVLSPECEGLEQLARTGAVGPEAPPAVVVTQRSGDVHDAPIPLVPEDAVERLVRNNGGGGP